MVVFREEERGRKYGNRNGQAGRGRRGKPIIGTRVEADKKEETKQRTLELPSAFES